MAAEPDPATAHHRPGSGWIATALYLAGLGGFVASALAFPVALLAGWDIRPVVILNAAAVGLLVGWAAYDTLHDPGSEVTTVPGALGTGMVLLAIYGLVAAIVVALSSPWHDHVEVAWVLGVGTLVAGVLGVLTFPLEVLVGGAEDAADEED